MPSYRLNHRTHIITLTILRSDDMPASLADVPLLAVGEALTEFFRYGADLSVTAHPIPGGVALETRDPTAWDLLANGGEEERNNFIQALDDAIYHGIHFLSQVLSPEATTLHPNMPKLIFEISDFIRQIDAIQEYAALQELDPNAFVTLWRWDGHDDDNDALPHPHHDA